MRRRPVRCRPSIRSDLGDLAASRTLDDRSDPADPAVAPGDAATAMPVRPAMPAALPDDDTLPPPGLRRRRLLQWGTGLAGALAQAAASGAPAVPAGTAGAAANGPGAAASGSGSGSAPPAAPAGTPPSSAWPIVTGQWVHALSAYAPPRHGPDFPHFPYVHPRAPKGGVLRLSNPDRRTSFDKLNPFTLKGVAPAAVSLFMVESLATPSMDEPEAWYGLLAEAMRVEPDLSAVTLRLRPQARFSDGSPVEAADVVDTVRRLHGPLLSPGYATLLEGLGTPEALDARTVRIPLRRRQVETVFDAIGLPVVSRRWGAGKPFKDLVTEPPICSGPYVIERAEMPSRLTLQRNPAYWASDLPVRRGHFNFGRIEYRLYQDAAVRREAFKAGEFDILREYSASQFVRTHQGPKWRDGRIVKARFPIATGSMLQSTQFNLRNPKFQDIRVREAIVRAWDFAAVNRFRVYEPSESLFANTDFAATGLPSAAERALLEPYRATLPPAVFGPPWRVPAGRGGPDHAQALRDSLKTAARLLAEAGWTVAADGRLRNAKGEALEVEYLEPSSNPSSAIFKRNLDKLGIVLRERQVDYALYRQRLENFDFELITIVEGQFTLPSAGTLKELFGSTSAVTPGGGNTRGVRSPVVDALIARLEQARSLDDLRTAARALDRVVMHSWWQVPELYSRTLPLSYWARFGLPAVPAPYMAIDSLPDNHSQPWPLWTWWDRSLGDGGAPASPTAPRPASG
ncbi:MAG: hypothetical protein RIQ53_4660 [Pseudomonadota bacterium]